MEEEFWTVHVSPFVHVVDAVRILSRLNRNTRQNFSSLLDPSWWESMAQKDDHFVDNFKLSLKYSNRKAVISDLYLLLINNPTELINLRCSNGDSVFHILARGNELGLIQLCARMVPTFDPNDRGAGSMTALHCAAFANSQSVCKWLISVGADAGLLDAIERWPEDWATIRQAHELAKFLRHARKGKNLNPKPPSCVPFISL